MKADRQPDTVQERKIGRAELRIFEDREAVFAAAADEFLDVLIAAVRARGFASVALAGGNTPRSLYSIVAARAAELDWSRVHIFFGDERCVPPDDPQSNFRMARESLLSAPQLSAAHVYRMKGELPPAEAAREYEQDLRGYFGSKLPCFDLILLGIGPDGHTASLFPGSSALDIRDRWVTGNWVEKLGVSRITFTLPLLNHAAEVMFLVTEGEKRDAVRRIFVDHESLPAAHVQPSGRLLWMLQAAAAADLL